MDYYIAKDDTCILINAHWMSLEHPIWKAISTISMYQQRVSFDESDSDQFPQRSLWNQHKNDL